MKEKEWDIRYLAFLGWAEGPEASTETRPPDLWLLAQLPCFFLCLKNTSGTSSYSTSQACRPGLVPPIKPTTHFQPSHCTLNLKYWQFCHLDPINLSFPYVVWSLFRVPYMVKTVWLRSSAKKVCKYVFLNSTQ
jgi:hypothetical protein